ncbi:MAG: potassium transporter TrkG, partial [Pirellulales bacterium]
PANKLIDAAGAVAATLNNIGPGLGVIGATKNYTHFVWYTKLMMICLMMLGRLELYVILVLFVPRFWRSQ